MKIVFVYCYDGWFIYCEEIKGCEFNGGVVQLGQKGGYLYRKIICLVIVIFVFKLKNIFKD